VVVDNQLASAFEHVDEPNRAVDTIEAVVG